MKLFNFFTVGALASEMTLSRTRRDVAYSFSGEEAADFYSDILADISGKYFLEMQIVKIKEDLTDANCNS